MIEAGCVQADDRQAGYAHRRIDLMSWTTYRDRLLDDPIIFLPVGALEQHGPHLPMGCDAILVGETFCKLPQAERAAKVKEFVRAGATAL